MKQARKFILCIFLLPSLAQASKTLITSDIAKQFDIAFLNEKQSPENYLKKVEFKFSKPVPPNASLIYGGESFGFFRSTHIRQDKGSIHFSFFPPYFTDEIHFYLDTGTNIISLGKRAYKEKDQLFKKLFKFKMLEGKFKTPFFTLPIRFTIDDNPKHHFYWGVFILNKKGQIVWGNFEPNFPYAYLEKLDDQQYFLKGLYHDVIMTKKGKQNFSYSIPFSHHDCQKHGIKMICLSEVKKFIKTNFYSKPKEVVGFNLIEIDLNTHLQQEVWNVFNNGLQIIELAKNKYEKMKETDWFHANSLQVINNNFLISLRNLNRVIEVNSKSKKIINIWGDKHFYGQHHARYIEDNLYIFDNGKSKSSIKNFYILNKKLKLNWRFTPSDTIHSKHHGSIYPMDERLFSYFLHEKEFEHHFFEIDKKTGLAYNHALIQPTKLISDIKEYKFSFFIYRSQPLKNLEREVFIGENFDYSL